MMVLNLGSPEIWRLENPIVTTLPKSLHDEYHEPIRTFGNLTRESRTFNLNDCPYLLRSDLGTLFLLFHFDMTELEENVFFFDFV